MYFMGLAPARGRCSSRSRDGYRRDCAKVAIYALLFAIVAFCSPPCAGNRSIGSRPSRAVCT